MFIRRGSAADKGPALEHGDSESDVSQCTSSRETGDTSAYDSNRVLLLVRQALQGQRAASLPQRAVSNRIPRLYDFAFSKSENRQNHEIAALRFSEISI